MADGSSPETLPHSYVKGRHHGDSRIILEKGGACCFGRQASGALYGVLLAGNGVVALSQPRAHPLHIHDLLLLCSFVRGTTSFRQPATESFSPVCLPHFNAAAFLHAYVRYLHLVGACEALLARN